MNRHLKHVLLIRLSDHLQDTRQFCADLSTPLQDLILCGSVPIDLQDKVTQRFFELMNYDPNLHNVDLSRFRYHVIEALVGLEKDHAMDGSIAFQEFLEGVDEGNGWEHLNRFFRHMTGSSLWEIIDVSSVLMHPLDQGLDGDQWLSATLEVARLDRGESFLIAHTVAIASTLEHVLLLIRDDVLRGDDSYDFLRRKRSPDKAIGTESPIQLEPVLVTIKKNNQYLMQLPIKCAEAEGEYEVDWERGRFRASMEIIKSISAVAPPEVGNRIKGRYLENEMGL